VASSPDLHLLLQIQFVFFFISSRYSFLQLPPAFHVPPLSNPPLLLCVPLLPSIPLDAGPLSLLSCASGSLQALTGVTYSSARNSIIPRTTFFLLIFFLPLSSPFRKLFFHFSGRPFCLTSLPSIFSRDIFGLVRLTLPFLVRPDSADCLFTREITPSVFPVVSACSGNPCFHLFLFRFPTPALSPLFVAY